MTYSMTGYGKYVCQYQGRALTIEVRTLNSKQGDINVRMPSIYREKELELRDMISQRLERGKVDLSIQRDLAEEELTSEVNEAMVEKYYSMIKRMEDKIEGESSKDAVDYLSLIFKLPDVLRPVTEQLEEKEFEVVRAGLKECLDALLDFRAQEGKKLEGVLKASTESILQLLKDVEPLEKERMERIRARITNNMGEEAESPSFDPDRFEQELIYYLEKLDITEEKVRLKAHCDYFLKTLAEEEIKGKKLSFIAQEMGREINTLGSKAQHSDMQRVVVNMKDELEKIKEQVLNVL